MEFLWQGFVDYGWYVLAGLCVVVGIIGTVLPVLPGIVLVYVGLLIAAIANGFERISGWTMAVLAIFVGFALVIDFIASAFGTKIAGASKWAFGGAAVGVLVGLFFGLPGILLGPFIGAVLFEVVVTQNVGLSLKAGVGATLGMFVGGLAKVALTFAMIGMFLLAWFL